MKKLSVVLVTGLVLLSPLPAGGEIAPSPREQSTARVTGTYQVTAAPKSVVESLFDSSGSATWSFDATPSQRVLVGALTQAAYGPFVSNCTQAGDGTVVDKVVGPGTDRAANLEFAVTANLLKGTTKATLRLMDDTGFARWETDRECTGDYAAGNGITAQDVAAAGMFPNGTVGYDPWPMRQDDQGRWHIDGVQSESASTGFGSSGAEVHAIIHGSLKAIHAACTIPTVRQMRHVTSFAQGTRLVERAGFGTPYIGGTLHIRWAPRGHFYVDELGFSPIYPCGGRLHLYRS